MNVSGGKFYFLDEAIYGRVRYMNLDGSDMRQLGPFNGDNLLVSDGMVFYTRDRSVYTISKNGSETLKADRISPDMLVNIIGRYIYWYENYISNNISKTGNLFDYPEPSFEGTYKYIIGREKLVSE